MPSVPVFVRSSTGTNGGTTVTTTQQLDLGNLVVVGFVNSEATNNTSVADNLGNTYLVAIQGDTFPPDPPATTGQILLAYTYVTSPGMATITGTATGSGALVLLVSQYQRPAGLELAQIAHELGTAPQAPGDTSRGTTPVNYANSLLITLAHLNSPSSVFSSVDGDTVRCRDGLNLGIGQPAQQGALCEAILTGPGIRNSTVYWTPGGGAGTVVAVWSVARARPVNLDSQAAVRPGFSGSLPFSYGGQPAITVSLPYMPQIGSIVLVGAIQSFVGGDTVPTYTATDAYGNSYTQLRAYQDNGVTAALFQTIVTALPSSGVFSATVSMDVFHHDKIVSIAEYLLTPIVDFETLIFAGKTSLPGSLMRMFTNSVLVSAPHLIAGFASIANGTGVPTPWTSSASFTIDTQWNIGQLEAVPNPNYPTIRPGAWIHKYVTSNGTYDAEIITTDAGFAGIIAVTVSTGFGSLYAAKTKAITPASPSGGSGALYK